MKAYIGIDPGGDGAVALMLENGAAAVVDLQNVVQLYDLLKSWQAVYDVQAVALEKTHGRKGNSSASDTTFQRHCGGCSAAVEIAGLPLLEPRPQDWMYRRVKAKTGPKDKPSVEYVRARYPYIGLFGPKGGVKDGRSDAVCIAEWCWDQFDKGE